MCVIGLILRTVQVKLFPHKCQLLTKPKARNQTLPVKEVRGGAVHRRAGPPVARRLVEAGSLASVQLKRDYRVIQHYNR